MSAVSPSQGEQQFVSKRVQAFLRDIGADAGDITLESDQEPSIKALLNEVSRPRAAAGGGRTVIEHITVQDSRGNGVIERAVKSTEGQIRVARSTLVRRIGANTDPGHAVMTWMIEYVSLLLNRHEVGRDCCTAYERSRKKSSKLMGLEFGESVMWRRRPVGNNLAKSSLLRGLGAYLGVKGSTGEIFIGSTDAVWHTRTVRRRPKKLMCQVEDIEKIKGLPSDTGEAIRDELSMPKACRTKRGDHDKYGYSRGCRALLIGVTRQKHTAQCRQ
jgi:hypothetical protein